MDEKQTIEKLTEMGGKLWEKGSYRRIYFDDGVILDADGLKVSYYNSGNVSSASYRGEAISNSEAKRILSQYVGGKFWYDLTDGKFYSKTVNKLGEHEGFWKNFVKAARTAIA